MTLDALFDAVLAHLRAVAAVLPDESVEADRVVEWTGEHLVELPEVDLSDPVLQVDYPGGEMDPRPQVRGVNYTAREIFAVYVSVGPDETGTVSAFRRARRLLDGLETNAQGPVAGTPWALKRVGDKVRRAQHLGRVTYEIRFEVARNVHKSW